MNLIDLPADSQDLIIPTELGLLDLPEEILALIIQQLPSYRDHFALAGMCHHLHERVFAHVRKLRFL